MSDVDAIHAYSTFQLSQDLTLLFSSLLICSVFALQPIKSEEIWKAT
ncbi:MAG: hypothetical protein R8M38_03460 [Mariprofundaceae bacterium]